MYKEPPRSSNWNGPEKAFLKWVNELEPWERLTSFPEHSWGILLYKSFPRPVQDQLAHVEIGDQLSQPDALAKIKEVLLRNYSYVGKYDVQEDFERALFYTSRSKGQSLLNLISVFQAGFWWLETHWKFTPMSDDQQGSIFLKHAKMAQTI